MLVGVPKEIKPQEGRVGLTPGAVQEYVAHGHRVLVETGAGAGIGASDDAYRAAGATIADTAAEVFAAAGMVVKVQDPQPHEWTQLRAGLSTHHGQLTSAPVGEALGMAAVSAEAALGA